jgi:uncharacterized protein (TIGR03435 family)
MTRKFLLAMFCCAAFSVPSAWGQGSAAQTANSAIKLPEWDIVSIKLNKNPDESDDIYIGPDSDGITISNMRLQWIIQVAYDFNHPNLVYGMPDWAKSKSYDISAKVSSADVALYRQLTDAQREQMLQRILTDRFKLQIHREPRQLPIYALVVAKNGAKLKESKAGEASSIAWVTPTDMKAQGASMASLATVLSGTRGDGIDRQVMDRTGLTGIYDFTLHITREPGAGSVSAPSASGSDFTGLSIFTAIQEQLGLKLEPARGPVECFVIDQVEGPSEN